MTEQTIYAVLSKDFLAALLNTGVGVCGGSVVKTFWRCAYGARHQPKLIECEGSMATFGLIEYGEAFACMVRAVYHDIMATRQTDYINNFWKALAHDPASLKRTWESLKQIMQPGALDPLTKEMMYLAISASNQCGYCTSRLTPPPRVRPA